MIRTEEEARLAASLSQKTTRSAHPKQHSTDPLGKDYWTEEHQQWLEELVEENNNLYTEYMLSDEHAHTYRGSTSNLVMELKACPEWAGLTVSAAVRAIKIGLGKILREGGDLWSLLPENELKGISAQEDFAEAWTQLTAKLDARSVERAVKQAKREPIAYSEELAEKLAPLTDNFKVFCDAVLYLQTMAGPSGHIILPQHQLAEFIGNGLKQSAVSSYCRRAERAGLLVKVDARYSEHERRAMRWRSSAHFSKGLKPNHRD